jgi:hypothetical protein
MGVSHAANSLADLASGLGREASAGRLAIFQLNKSARPA